MKKLIVLMCLLCVCSVSQGNEPNLFTGYDELLEMGVDSNDGFTLGLYAQEAAEPGEGGLVARLGYDYGVLNIFGGCDIQAGNYFDFGLKLKSRDLAEVKSVLFLSDIILMFADTDAEITAFTGFSHSWESNNDYTSTLAGLSIKGHENSPVSYEPEVRMPLDRSPTFHFGIQYKF